MAVYRRETRVKAPLADVWEFHSRVSGLEALTPGFLDLRVESVHGPDGTSNPEQLETGTTIHMSMRPLGVGPRQEWTSVITAREAGEQKACFRDRMEEGPFPHWVHTHEFYAVDDVDETLVVDRVEYRLPGGAVGQFLEPFGNIGFEPMFRYRHRRTKALLED